MKSFQKILAGMLALMIASVAMAQSTTVRITGSTAFRKAAIIGIQNILQTGYTYGYTGSSVTGGSQAVFVGTTKVGSLPVVIKCSWAGSTGGVQTVAQQSPVITRTDWISETGNTLTAAGAALASPVFDAATAADVAFSDSFQASSIAYGPGYTNLVDNIVGVVTFVFTKGLSADPTVSAALANFTNITPLQAKLVLAAGAPLSMFTGSSADSAIYVYPMGRDEDSGTRLSELSESEFGIFNSPIQYQPTPQSGGSITSIAPWPAATILGFNYPAGHSGFSGGGALATALNQPVAATAKDSFGAKFALIAYFGVNDAAGVNGGANNLTFNGVPYSDAAVREGKYTCWSYEHLMYRPTLTGNTKTVADQIANQIKTADAAQSGVLLSTMNVSRAVEGGTIIHN